MILPVFAGMVPCRCSAARENDDSPRIRGDGPCLLDSLMCRGRFSPYSRGWSERTEAAQFNADILPVFAGMVLPTRRQVSDMCHSPRIRGDGPEWGVMVHGHDPILPVFAGMVPGPVRWLFAHSDSPRIRGDGPALDWLNYELIRFSPYSRGWSLTS